VNPAAWFTRASQRHRRRRPRADRERGSAVIETVIGVPAFMLFVGLIVFAGRVAIANQAVGSAANEAARAASISRTQGQAGDTARTAAMTALTNQKVNCLRTTVTVDTTGFASPVGTPASVQATVSCVVNLSDVSVPGVPGTRTVTATMSSPLDTYRER
jgi:Flp pilus assembly protein TadG